MTRRHPPKEIDWNVVITLPEDTFREARGMLSRWGRVEGTGYYNVLVMQVAEPGVFLETPGLLNFVSHVVPLQESFQFDSSEAFEREARAIAMGWFRHLAGGSFYVRLASPGVQRDHLDAARRALPR